MRVIGWFQRIVGTLTCVATLANCGGKNASAPVADSGGNHLLVFASDRNLSSGNLDIFLYDLDQQGFRALRGINSSAAESHPTLSSDGRFIAFVSTRAAASDIYLYDRAAGALINLPGVNTVAAETDPAFSDNALRLAFTRVDGNGFTRIHVDDGVPDTLLALPGLDTTATWNDWAPAPNSDASTIAFVSDRNGTPDVFVWQSGVGVLDLPSLRSDSTDFEPALSGDGRYLFFASNRSGAGTHGGFDVWAYDLQDGSLTDLAFNTAANERHPSSSRRGDQMVFVSDRAGGQGKWDVWNYAFNSGVAAQATGESSTADDIDPGLRWR